MKFTKEENRLRLELLKKGQRIKELEKDLSKERNRWRQYYQVKDWRENKKNERQTRK
jgi:hypothetical protein